MTSDQKKYLLKRLNDIKNKKISELNYEQNNLDVQIKKQIEAVNSGKVKVKDNLDMVQDIYFLQVFDLRELIISKIKSGESLKLKSNPSPHILQQIYDFSNVLTPYQSFIDTQLKIQNEVTKMQDELMFGDSTEIINKISEFEKTLDAIIHG